MSYTSGLREALQESATYTNAAVLLCAQHRAGTMPLGNLLVAYSLYKNKAVAT